VIDMSGMFENATSLAIENIPFSLWNFI